LPAFSLLSLVVTICALGVYALAQIGLARYFWRLGNFNPFWHGLVPTLAVAAIIGESPAEAGVIVPASSLQQAGPTG